MSSHRSIKILAVMVWVTSTGCLKPINFDFDFDDPPVTPVAVMQDIKSKDKDQFTPAVRVSLEVYPGLDRRREGSLLDLVKGASVPSSEKTVSVRNSRIKPTFAVVSELARVEGRDTQRLRALEFVTVDQTLAGPAPLKVTSEHLRGHVAARGGVRFFDIVSLEGILGLGVDNTELRLRGNAFDVQDENLEAGVLLGARLAVRFIPLFDIYGQYVANYINSDADTRDAQVGLELNLSRNVSLYSGYRWWTYEEKKVNSGSDLELSIRGPTAGISLKF